MPKSQLYTQKCIQQISKCSMHVSNRKVIYKGDIDQRSMPKNIPSLAPKLLRFYCLILHNLTNQSVTQPGGELLLGLPALLTMHQVNAEKNTRVKQPYALKPTYGEV